MVDWINGRDYMPVIRRFECKNVIGIYKVSVVNIA